MSRPVFSIKRLIRRALVLTHRYVFGTVLVVVLLVGFLIYGALTWTEHKLAKGWTIGQVSVQVDRLKVGWDLSLRANHLSIQAPGIHVIGQDLRARPVLSKNFFAVYPTLRVSLLSTKIQFIPTEPKASSVKVPTFPELRWPMPWRIEVGTFQVSRADTLLIQINDFQAESRGMLGVKSKATVLPGDWGKALPEALRLGLKVELTSRWKGPNVRYRLQVHTFQGDSLNLRGERDRKDLRLAKDSLGVYCSTPALYAADSLAPTLAVYHDLGLELSLNTRQGIAYAGNLYASADTVLLAGPVNAQVAWHGGLKRAWVKARILQGQNGIAEIESEIPFQNLGDSDTTIAALSRLRPATTRFSAWVQNVYLTVGGAVLPADLKLNQGTWVPGQLMTGEVITAAGSKVNLAFYLRKAWLLAFDGKVAAQEPWAHGWTDTNITFDFAKAKGQVRANLVKVQATAFQIQAYQARADSVKCWTTITGSQFRLDSTRIYDDGHLWKGNGYVTWKKRGVFLTNGVELEFNASNPSLGSGRFRMPHSGQLEAHAENVAVHANPYTLLKMFTPYQPRVSGDFEWNLLTQTGKTQVTVSAIHSQAPVNVNLTGDWDPKALHVKELTLEGEDLRATVSALIQMKGNPFYNVYRSRFSDLSELDLAVSRMDVATWLSRFTSKSPLKTGELAGDLKFTAEDGIHGTLVLKQPALKGQPEGLTLGDFSMKGLGDTLQLKMATHSKSEPFFNTSTTLQILHPLTQTPEFILDGAWHDSLRLAGRASLDLSRTLRGAIGLIGSLPLPSESGNLRQLHLLTRFEMPTQAGFKKLKATSQSFEGVFDSHRLPAQTFSGHLKSMDGVIYLDSLKLVDPDQKILWAKASYAFGPPSALTFQMIGDAFALQIQKNQFIHLKQLDIQGGLKLGTFQLAAKIGAAQYSVKQGSVTAEGVIDGLAMEYVLPPFEEGKNPEPAKLQVKGTLAKTLVAHKIRLGPEELKRIFGYVLHFSKNKSKPVPSSGTTNSGGSKSRSMDLNIAIDTRGQENRIETEVGRLNFTGDLRAKGVYPYLLMNGTIASLKGGEIGQKNQAYDLRDLELKWQNATPEEGTISLEGDKRLKVDCNPQTQKTCHVTIRFSGRLDEAKFSYETDCGGDEGEAIKPTAIINSVANGCFTGNLSGGDNQGDYGKTIVNLLTPYVNSTLTKAFTAGSAGLIQNAKVTGLDNLVAGENAQAVLDEPVALNLESKEKYRIKLLGRGGFFPASKQSSAYDLKVVAEWRPPFDEWVVDSVWKNRLKDRITVDAGIETRPEERNTDVERQVRRQVGLKYKYQFWKFW